MIEPNGNELPGQTNAANGQTRSARASQRSGTLPAFEVGMKWCGLATLLDAGRIRGLGSNVIQTLPRSPHRKPVIADTVYVYSQGLSADRPRRGADLGVAKLYTTSKSSAGSTGFGR